ncbi:hypothetical protein [Armatimonas sp.]|uniref:hypothetical protein n=1 Tax=Armatimonas sp. TaxID=1872638 RepID=UPI00286B5EA4|nr:hypothetical protein [Armatimonas sp.]
MTEKPSVMTPNPSVMSEQEAAQYLSVTARTLLNYRKSGRLSYRLAQGKTRPVIEYDRANLERLKAELIARTEVPKTPKPTRLKRVTFGLAAHDYEELSGEAKKYDMKPGEYARRLMRESLESNLKGEIRELHTKDAKSREELKRLRNDVAGAFEALLEFMKLSPEEASQWVTENLR